LLTSDQKVAGSSPAGCTNKIKDFEKVPARSKTKLGWGLCWSPCRARAVVTARPAAWSKLRLSRLLAALLVACAG
ncbi:MAG: hypothetical protein ACREE6_14000, partial [Limisphaerales bacterium]